MKYKCKKSFSMTLFDENGFPVENEYIQIRAGDIFEKSDDPYRDIGGKDSVRLDNKDMWVEITPETLKQFFDCVEG